MANVIFLLILSSIGLFHNNIYAANNVHDEVDMCSESENSIEKKITLILPVTLDDHIGFSRLP
jgi:hypothetical protein